MSKRVLVIDNYDSFTFNLVQYLGELGAELDVYRNDEITIDAVRQLNPDRIVISPGPGRPSDAGISSEIIREFYKDIPILGVCLGHQCIGEVFGATVIHAPYLMHGKTSMMTHDGKGVFAEIESPMEATRYHSLILDRDTIPKELLITSWTDDNLVMGVRHESAPLEGIQFHPESILTTHGKALLKNFLEKN